MAVNENICGITFLCACIMYMWQTTTKVLHTAVLILPPSSIAQEGWCGNMFCAMPQCWNLTCWASSSSTKTGFWTKWKWKRTSEEQMTTTVCTNFFKLQHIILKASLYLSDTCRRKWQLYTEATAKIFNPSSDKCVNMTCNIKYLPPYLLSTRSNTPECITLCISCIACWKMFNKKSSHEAGTQFLYIISLMAPIARVPIFWCSSWDIP